MTQSEANSAFLFGLIVFGGLGYLFGSYIGGQEKSERALEWAVSATAECERSFIKDEFESVAECLQHAITVIEDERKADQHDEGKAMGRR